MGFVTGLESSADGGVGAESAKERCGGGDGENVAGGAAAGKGAPSALRPGGGGNGLEALREAADLFVVAVRGEHLGECAFAGAGKPDGGETGGVAVGERAEENGVNDAEYGYGRADAEGEGENGEDGGTAHFT